MPVYQSFLNSLMKYYLVVSSLSLLYSHIYIEIRYFNVAVLFRHLLIFVVALVVRIAFKENGEKEL